MKYKALVLDLDGTTVKSHEGSHPRKKVKDAIKQAQKHLKVSIATGRPYYHAGYIFEELEIDQPCVVDGGAQIINPKTGHKYFEKLLSIEKQKQIVKICLRFPHLFTAANATKGHSQKVTSINDINRPSTKIYVGGLKNQDAIRLLAELESVTGIAAHISSSWHSKNLVDIHVTYKNATKKHAIEKLLKILKATKAETIGIGDYYNDLPLLESVGFKVAMGNAPDEIKAVADYIAPDLEHEGVADVIEKFILEGQS